MEVNIAVRKAIICGIILCICVVHTDTTSTVAQTSTEGTISTESISDAPLVLSPRNGTIENATNQTPTSLENGNATQPSTAPLLMNTDPPATAPPATNNDSSPTGNTGPSSASSTVNTTDSSTPISTSKQSTTPPIVQEAPEALKSKEEKEAAAAAVTFIAIVICIVIMIIVFIVGYFENKLTGFQRKRRLSVFVNGGVNPFTEDGEAYTKF